MASAGASASDRRVQGSRAAPGALRVGFRAALGRRGGRLGLHRSVEGRIGEPGALRWARSVAVSTPTRLGSTAPRG